MLSTCACVRVWVDAALFVYEYTSCALLEPLANIPEIVYATSSLLSYFFFFIIMLKRNPEAFKPLWRGHYQAIFSFQVIWDNWGIVRRWRFSHRMDTQAQRHTQTHTDRHYRVHGQHLSLFCLDRILGGKDGGRSRWRWWKGRSGSSLNATAGYTIYISVMYSRQVCVSACVCLLNNTTTTSWI